MASLAARLPSQGGAENKQANNEARRGTTLASGAKEVSPVIDSSKFASKFSTRTPPAVTQVRMAAKSKATPHSRKGSVARTGSKQLGSASNRRADRSTPQSNGRRSSLAAGHSAHSLAFASREASIGTKIADGDARECDHLDLVAGIDLSFDNALTQDLSFDKAKCSQAESGAEESMSQEDQHEADDSLLFEAVESAAAEACRLEKQLEEVTAKCTDLRDQCSELQSEIKNGNKERKSLQLELADSQATAAREQQSLKNVISELKAQIQTSSTEVASLKMQRSQHCQSLTDLEAQVAQWHSAFSDCKQQLADTERSTESRVSELEQQLADAERGAQCRVSELEQQLADSKHAVSELEQQLADAERSTESRVSELEQQLADAERGTESRVSELEQQLADTERGTESRVSELEQQLAESKHAVSALEEQTEIAALKIEVSEEAAQVAMRQAEEKQTAVQADLQMALHENKKLEKKAVKAGLQLEEAESLLQKQRLANEESNSQLASYKALREAVRKWNQFLAGEQVQQKAMNAAKPGATGPFGSSSSLRGVSQEDRALLMQLNQNVQKLHKKHVQYILQVAAMEKELVSEQTMLSFRYAQAAKIQQREERAQSQPQCSPITALEGTPQEQENHEVRMNGRDVVVLAPAVASVDITPQQAPESSSTPTSNHSVPPAGCIRENKGVRFSLPLQGDGPSSSPCPAAVAEWEADNMSMQGIGQATEGNLEEGLSETVAAKLQNRAPTPAVRKAGPPRRRRLGSEAEQQEMGEESNDGGKTLAAAFGDVLGQQEADNAASDKDGDEPASRGAASTGNGKMAEAVLGIGAGLAAAYTAIGWAGGF